MEGAHGDNEGLWRRCQSGSSHRDLDLERPFLLTQVTDRGKDK